MSNFPDVVTVRPSAGSDAFWASKHIAAATDVFGNFGDTTVRKDWRSLWSYWGTAREEPLDLTIPESKQAVLRFDTSIAGNLLWVAHDQARTDVETRAYKVFWDLDELRRQAMEDRLHMLGRLHANHDNEGARAPIAASIEAAVNFLHGMNTPHNYSVTLNDDGLAVIEFVDEETGFEGDITFLEDGSVECYCRPRRSEASEMIVGGKSTKAIESFLQNKMDVFG